MSPMMLDAPGPPFIQMMLGVTSARQPLPKPPKRPLFYILLGSRESGLFQLEDSKPQKILRFQDLRPNSCTQ